MAKFFQIRIYQKWNNFLEISISNLFYFGAMSQFYWGKKSVLIRVFNLKLKVIIALRSLHRIDFLGHRSLIAMTVLFCFIDYLKRLCLIFRPHP
jgi:hypothetical protein